MAGSDERGAQRTSSSRRKCAARLLGAQAGVPRPDFEGNRGNTLDLPQGPIRTHPRAAGGAQRSLYESRLARIPVCRPRGARGRAQCRYRRLAQFDRGFNPAPAASLAGAQDRFRQMSGRIFLPAIVAWLFIGLPPIAAETNVPVNVPVLKSAAVMDFELINEMREYETENTNAPQQPQ